MNNLLLFAIIIGVLIIVSIIVFFIIRKGNEPTPSPTSIPQPNTPQPNTPQPNTPQPSTVQPTDQNRSREELFNNALDKWAPN